MHRRVSIKLALSTVVAVSSLAVPAQSQAQAWLAPIVQAAMNPFGRDFIDLTEEDMSLLSAAMRTVLEKRVVGATEPWKNEQSSHAGVASLIKAFDRDGRPCGTVHHDFTEGNGKPYILSLCRFEDGTWKILP
jgi:surface antigen